MIRVSTIPFQVTFSSNVEIPPFPSYHGSRADLLPSISNPKIAELTMKISDQVVQPMTNNSPSAINNSDQPLQPPSNISEQLPQQISNNSEFPTTSNTAQLSQTTTNDSEFPTTTTNDSEQLPQPTTDNSEFPINHSELPMTDNSDQLKIKWSK